MEQANYTQAIEAAIEMVEARVAEHGDRFRLEAHTRYWLVDTVLAGLGWDVHEPSLRRVSYSWREMGRLCPLAAIHTNSRSNRRSQGHLSRRNPALDRR